MKICHNELLYLIRSCLNQGHLSLVKWALGPQQLIAALWLEAKSLKACATDRGALIKIAICEISRCPAERLSDRRLLFGAPSLGMTHSRGQARVFVADCLAGLCGCMWKSGLQWSWSFQTATYFSLSLSLAGLPKRVGGLSSPAVLSTQRHELPGPGSRVGARPQWSCLTVCPQVPGKRQESGAGAGTQSSGWHTLPNRLFRHVHQWNLSGNAVDAEHRVSFVWK